MHLIFDHACDFNCHQYLHIMIASRVFIIFLNYRFACFFNSFLLPYKCCIIYNKIQETVSDYRPNYFAEPWGLVSDFWTFCLFNDHQHLYKMRRLPSFYYFFKFFFKNRVACCLTINSFIVLN